MILLEILHNLNIAFEENVPIEKLTSMNQKSILPIVAKPDSVTKLKELIQYCVKHHVVFDVLGGLTNTYLCESYYKKLVIVTTFVCDKEIDVNTVVCGCGYNLTKLAKECINLGIAGYEGFVGIPGTIGAATINNSGAFGSSMSKIVKSVKLILLDGIEVEYSNSQLEYENRNSLLKREHLGYILSVTMDISNREDFDLLQLKLKELTTIRKKTIDGYRKSLGSVFVSTSLNELYKRHRLAFLLRKVFFVPLKYIIRNHRKRNEINTWLTFFFLRNPNLAKHCDSLNRFCWTKNTEECDLFNYIEIDIKK